MRRFQPQDDEARLLEEEMARAEETHTNYKIPLRAIKSIAVAVLLVLFGMGCLCVSIFSFNGSLEYLFGNRRIMFFILSLVTLPCGSWTLILAYRCYYRYDGYRWPMIFL